MTAGFATDSVLATVASALVAESAYLGWGGGTGQSEAATDLASPFAEDRVSGTAVATTTTTAGDTYRLTGTLTATDTRAVTEVGVFAAPTGAGMQVYGEFPAINLTTGDSISFTIDVVVDQV